MNDAISPQVQALLELFGAELKSVKFPDVDGALLGGSAQKVAAAAEAVARAEAALESARIQLAESQEQLLGKAQRALAYARVFAEDAPELSSKLDAISLPRAKSRPKAEPLAPSADQPAAPPKRRGRPPKTDPNASLFAAELTVEAVEQAG